MKWLSKPRGTPITPSEFPIEVNEGPSQAKKPERSITWGRERLWRIHTQGPTVLYRNLKPLILASASPRRRMMLETLGIEFGVVPSGVDECPSKDDGDPETLARRWALEKAERVAAEFPAVWVLAADTVVVLGDRVFGKPSGEPEAFFMLKALSGETHRVFSGIALINREEGISRQESCCTSVSFRNLRPAEIRAYVGTREPFDKAGAYGIQDLGAFLVRSIQGSYTNVVGLPLGEVLDWLLHHEIIEPR